MTESPGTDPSPTGQTLEEAEAQPWGDPPDDASYLVTRCHALRRVPLGDFSPGDLLAVVLRLDDAYWTAHPDERAALVGLARTADPAADELADTDVPALVTAFLAGRENQPG